MGFALLGYVPNAEAAVAADPCLSERQEWASHYQGPALAEISGITPANERDEFLSAARNLGTGNDLQMEYNRRGADPMQDPEFFRQVVALTNKSLSYWDSRTDLSPEQRQYMNIAGERAGAVWVACMAGKFARDLRTPPSTGSQTAMNAPNNGAALGSRSISRNSGQSGAQSNNGGTNIGNANKESKPGSIAEIANHCVSLVKDPGLYGGFENSCGYPISIAWCAYHPTKGAWSEAFDCDHDAKGIGRGGLSLVGANQIEGDHTHNAEMIFWFPCRRPAYPVVTYTTGVGFYGYCK